eukprot:649325-Alexandrium_andersonii.AAC.1
MLCSAICVSANARTQAPRRRASRKPSCPQRCHATTLAKQAPNEPQRIAWALLGARRSIPGRQAAESRRAEAG